MIPLGACLGSTGTLQSITFMAKLAHIQAMVPPPASTLPISLVGHYTPAPSIPRRTPAMKSAFMSLAPLLVLAPVYLLKHTPIGTVNSYAQKRQQAQEMKPINRQW